MEGNRKFLVALVSRFRPPLQKRGQDHGMEWNGFGASLRFGLSNAAPNAGSGHPDFHPFRVDVGPGKSHELRTAEPCGPGQQNHRSFPS
jgi:hypothetical protein